MVKMNRPTVKRMTLLRSSVVAMIRGVSCPLATWIATRSDPKVKTMNEIVSVSTVFRASDVPAGVAPNQGTHPSRSCSPNTRRMAIFSSTSAKNGTIQSAERK